MVIDATFKIISVISGRPVFFIVGGILAENHRSIRIHRQTLSHKC
jgi:hypothetical protein